MNKNKHYIRLGNGTTTVLLNGIRTEVQEGEIVVSEKQLSGGFKLFDANLVLKYDEEIIAQEQSIASSEDSFDEREKEMIARHKSELKALRQERETVKSHLDEKLSNIKAKKEHIVLNISKAFDIIDEKITDLAGQKDKINDIMNGVAPVEEPKEPIIDEGSEQQQPKQISQMNGAELRLLADSLGITTYDDSTTKNELKEMIITKQEELAKNEGSEQQ